MRTFITLLPAFALAAATFAGPAASETPERRHIATVEIREPAFMLSGSLRRYDYVAAPPARRSWRLCSSFASDPTGFLDDIVEGARELARWHGAQLDLPDGVLTALRQQEQTIRRCLEADADAIVVVAAGAPGLGAVLQEAAERNVPVINVGIATDGGVTAQVVQNASAAGAAAGDYLADSFPRGGTRARVAWFPGPDVPGFGRDADAGFREAIANGEIEVVGGSTSLEETTLRTTLERILAGDTPIDAIAGVAPAALLAASMVGDSDTRPIILSTSFAPVLREAIAEERIDAAVNSRPVIAGRIAADLAIRALEGRRYLRDIVPTVEIVDRSNLPAPGERPAQASSP